MFRNTGIALFVLFSMAMSLSALAAGNGQEDLDKAMEAKLNAESSDDLNKVIDLIESALDKGLDDSNTVFAKKLLASTYFLRAEDKTKNILRGVTSMEEFQQRKRSVLDDYEKSLKLDPEQPKAYVNIAKLNLLVRNGTKAAREALDKALALKFDSPIERAGALLLRAGIQQEPEKKLADLNEAVRSAPNNADVVRARGLTLADMDKPEPALADLNKALALEPQDVPTYEAKALVLARLEKFEEAIKSLDAALLLKPGNVAVYLLRSEVYQKQGKTEQALADVDKALEFKPGLIAAIQARAQLLAEAERYAEAIAELEILRENNPSDASTLFQLGLLFNADKQSEKALEIFSTLLSAEPTLWPVYRGRGDAYLNLGKHAEAVADYEKALGLEKDDQGLLNNLAWVLATSPDEKIRDGKRAVELATKACEVTEYKFSHILSTLAAAYAETGDFESAVKWSTKAVELDEKLEHGDELKRELENYKAKKPWRELLSEDKKADEKQ